MILAFSGATGRVDAGQAALMATHGLSATGQVATLVRVCPADGFPGRTELGIPCVDLFVGDASPSPTSLVRKIRQIETRGSHVVLDLPASYLRARVFREVVDISILAVGPYLSDERAAVALGADLDAVPNGRRPGRGGGERSVRPIAPIWHLGCRRPGGTTAAAAFAKAMAEASQGPCVRTLPVTVAAQGRSEIAAIEAGTPGARTLRQGILLVLALEAIAADAFAARVPPPGTHASNERERLSLTSDDRSFAEKLRDLADDLDAYSEGHGPSPDVLAAAPVLQRWARDTMPIPVLRGVVAEHPSFADGRHVRTSEVIVGDNATWARTLSRLYVLGEPEGGPSRATLQ